MVCKERIFQEIVPRLEEAEFVVGYSWFITRFKESLTLAAGVEEDWYLDPINSLLMEDSSDLTTVGMLYNQL